MHGRLLGFVWSSFCSASAPRRGTAIAIAVATHLSSSGHDRKRGLPCHLRIVCRVADIKQIVGKALSSSFAQEYERTDKRKAVKGNNARR
ncbi:hypothetical protein J6590_004748 [Homalodisca vitripennis]|nr:hypothetical protein J6590_004748 [Homalodisca vitripennis]